MPTLAISAYGVELRMSNGIPLAPLTISNATNASPIVITTDAAHGITDVSYGVVANVAGNTNANGAWVLERVSPTQLKLRGSTGNAPYVAGADTLTISGTYAHVVELTNLEDVGASTTLVEATSHDSDLWGVSIPTFLRTGTMRATINHVPADPTHDWAATGLPYVMLQRTQRGFLVVLPNGTGAVRTVWAFSGYVTGFTEQAPVAGLLSAVITVEAAGDMVLTRT